MEASGDGDDDTEVKVHVTTESPVTDDYYYNNKKGTSDDEDDDLEGSGSGDGIEIDPIGMFFLYNNNYVAVCSDFFLLFSQQPIPLKL
jgi:hypothetical protein